MEFRKGTPEDLEMLTQNRMDFVTSIAPAENLGDFRQATRQYLAEHLRDGSLFYYVCIDGGRIVSSCILCVYRTLPIPSSPGGKSGLLLNVCTVREYRRRGLAKTLITRLIEDARAMGLRKLSLDYTDAGYPLYRSLGFVKCNRDMEMRL